jgi:cellobiose transport system permease protein
MSAISQVGTAPTRKSVSEATTSKSGLAKFLPMYLSIAPYYVLFLVFGLIPVLFSLYLAFQRWDGIGAMTFAGWNNFYFALTEPQFGKAIFNTFAIWVMSTIPMLLLALVMAFLVNQRGRSRLAYQLCFYIPNLTSVVAVTIIFKSLFGEQYGLINYALTSLHLPAVQWLTDPWGMKWAIALMSIWMWAGFNSLIYLAGIQAIPSELYEAARTDGANTWHTFWHITVPMLRPTILYTVITSTLGGLTLFTEPQVLFGGTTNLGGTGHEGLTMTLYQYGQGFNNHLFGYGAAVGWIISIILVVATAINWRIVQRGDR